MLPLAQFVQDSKKVHAREHVPPTAEAGGEFGAVCGASTPATGGRHRTDAAAGAGLKRLRRHLRWVTDDARGKIEKSNTAREKSLSFRIPLSCSSFIQFPFTTGTGRWRAQSAKKRQSMH